MKFAVRTPTHSAIEAGYGILPADQVKDIE
jgi:hypothetical protein